MNKCKKKSFRLFAAISLLLAIAAPSAIFAAYDINGHWAEEIINNSMAQGYINVYEDGSFRPDIPIKRGEFVALANKSMGYGARGTVAFPDVRVEDWFYDDVGIAHKEGYISGFADGTFRPNDVITRETAAVMVANMLHLNQNTEYASYFTDRELLSWSRGYVGAAVKAKVLSGYTDGSFNPKKSLTRAEAVSLINRVAGKKYDTSLDIASGYTNYYVHSDNYDSSYIPEERLSYQGTGISSTTEPDGGYYRLYNGNYGSAVEREEFRAGIMYAPRYAGTVKNISVDGDFEVTSFVYPESELTLEDVKITGRLVIYNIGKVTLNNCDIGKLEWRSTHTGSSVNAQGNTVVDETRIFKSVVLTQNGLTNGRGFRKIIFDESCRAGDTATIYGDCFSVTVDGVKARLVLEKGSVDTVEIAPKSDNCSVYVGNEAEVSFMDVQSNCYIEGYGSIELARISADGAIFDLKPKSVSGTKAPQYTSDAHESSDGLGKHSLEITVVDLNGIKLSGVSVLLGTQNAKTTGADGKVYFDNIPKGTYSCVLSRPYVASATKTVTVQDTAETYVVLEYDGAERYSMMFTLLDGNTPLSGITVTLESAAGEIFSVQSGIDGRAVFQDMAQGVYEYSADYGKKTARGSQSVTVVNKYITIDFSKISEN